MKTALVTGYPGFLAKNFAHYMAENEPEGIRWFFCHNRSWADHKTVSRVKAPNVSYKCCNLLYADSVEKMLDKIKPDYIFHFAAFSDPSANEPYRNHKLNIEMCSHLLQFAKQNTRFVLASSSAVYGDGTVFYNRASKESDPTSPTSIYGASKVACEALVQTHTNNGSINGICLRFPAIVGPNMTHGFIKDLVSKIKDKTQDRLHLFGEDPGSTKPFLHVSDAITACLYFGTQILGINNCINISPRDSASVDKIAKTVMMIKKIKKDIEFLGRKSVYKGDNQFVLLDPSLSLNAGCREAMSSYDAIRKAITEL